MVSIETEEEWRFINKEIQNRNIAEPQEWHVGLKKEQGDWKWVSGQPLTINKWQKGQPSGDGDVVVMAKDYPADTQGLLNDLRDDITKAFICEIPKGKTRKLKLLAYKNQIRQENDT